MMEYRRRRVDTDLLRFLETYMLGLGKRDVLTALAGHPRRWWTLDEIARATGRPPERIRTYVQDLVSKGVLQVRREGGIAFYRLSEDSQLLGTLARVKQRFGLSASWVNAKIREGTV